MAYQTTPGNIDTFLCKTSNEILTFLQATRDIINATQVYYVPASELRLSRGMTLVPPFRKSSLLLLHVPSEHYFHRGELLLEVICHGDL